MEDNDLKQENDMENTFKVINDRGEELCAIYFLHLILKKQKKVI